MENVLLQGFQQGNLEDQYFAQIQTINSARLSDPEFVLSPAQEETLLGIANSSSLEAGYAQTMLGILTGRVFMPKLPALMEERSNNSQTLQLSKVGVLLVSPNPANDVINIQLPKAIDRSANRILELRDIATGALIQQVAAPDDSNVSLSVQTVPAGIYVLTLREHGVVIARQKITVQH